MNLQLHKGFEIFKIFVFIIILFFILFLSIQQIGKNFFKTDIHLLLYFLLYFILHFFHFPFQFRLISIQFFINLAESLLQSLSKWEEIFFQAVYIFGDIINFFNDFGEAILCNLLNIVEDSHHLASLLRIRWQYTARTTYSWLDFFVDLIKLLFGDIMVDHSHFLQILH